ncbi:hypothetical protein PPL_03492 [Heterostelium album PN500]|uniref:Uncharacterized protein n=1 Tax=Heterostelium pallidum (strain ATCC 26659 / Pp 5 / PN500) TaxID=670386 RepID=D3B515_HETP5|nr:hypothetical protein PPL_03492 [Heterostelium album PN500]EFA83501.1 hypothetical protein PPL_03492 [Heterostelium album PN500]|eukprot:XP_020435618.1 hypothetical protein PPL_03492 [Heterostelium album PN500]
MESNYPYHDSFSHLELEQHPLFDENSINSNSQMKLEMDLMEHIGQHSLDTAVESPSLSNCQEPLDSYDSNLKRKVIKCRPQFLTPIKKKMRVEGLTSIEGHVNTWHVGTVLSIDEQSKTADIQYEDGNEIETLEFDKLKPYYKEKRTIEDLEKNSLIIFKLGTNYFNGRACFYVKPKHCKYYYTFGNTNQKI